MKSYLFIITFLIGHLTAVAQENITLSGGATFFNIEEFDTDATGFRITGTYEAGKQENKKFMHGVSLAYMLTNTSAVILDDDYDFKIRTIPMYYAPKLMFGSNKAMAFVKGAIGMQFTRFEVTATDYKDDDHDWGFYGGVGLGGMLKFSEKVFINLEYEWAYLSNTYYTNGMVHNAQLGLGFILH